MTTVEGLAAGDELRPLQAAFLEQGGVQCGFCTPGMLISATALLEREPDPTEDEVRIALSGNLCRCTGYDGIVKAVLDGRRLVPVPSRDAGQAGRAGASASSTRSTTSGPARPRSATVVRRRRTSSAVCAHSSRYRDEARAAMSGPSG